MTAKVGEVTLRKLGNSEWLDSWHDFRTLNYEDLHLDSAEELIYEIEKLLISNN